MAAAANKAGIVHVLLSFIESAVSLFIYTHNTHRDGGGVLLVLYEATDSVLF